MSSFKNGHREIRLGTNKASDKIVRKDKTKILKSTPGGHHHQGIYIYSLFLN